MGILTPPMISPRAELRLARSGLHQHGGPQSVASVGKPEQPHYESSYESDGLSYNFDTMLEDLDLLICFPTNQCVTSHLWQQVRILDLRWTPPSSNLYPHPLSYQGEQVLLLPPLLDLRQSDPISHELMSPPLQPPPHLTLALTPRCTAETAPDPACQQLMSLPLQPYTMSSRSSPHTNLCFCHHCCRCASLEAEYSEREKGRFANT